MIGRLVGKLVSDDIDGTVIIDVGGVGYEVSIPLGVVGRAPRTSDGSLALHVHTHVREDALVLYGFASDTERSVFKLLIGLPGVGPKLALAILSSLPPSELLRAVVAGDLRRLNRVPGVGKKTAERLILELKEKLPKLGISGGPTKPDMSLVPDERARLQSALTNMGYRSAEAEKAVTALGSRVGQEPISDLLRAALAELAS